MVRDRLRDRLSSGPSGSGESDASESAEADSTQPADSQSEPDVDESGGGSESVRRRVADGARSAASAAADRVGGPTLSSGAPSADSDGSQSGREERGPSGDPTQREDTSPDTVAERAGRAATMADPVGTSLEPGGGEKAGEMARQDPMDDRSASDADSATADSGTGADQQDDTAAVPGGPDLGVAPEAGAEPTRTLPEEPAEPTDNAADASSPNRTGLPGRRDRLAPSPDAPGTGLSELDDATPTGDQPAAASGDESAGSAETELQRWQQVEESEGVVGERARALEQRVIEETPGVSDPSQVRVARRGDRLRARLTERGQRAVAAEQFSQRTGLEFGADDVTMTDAGLRLDEAAQRRLNQSLEGRVSGAATNIQSGRDLGFRPGEGAPVDFESSTSFVDTDGNTLAAGEGAAPARGDQRVSQVERMGGRIAGTNPGPELAERIDAQVDEQAGADLQRGEDYVIRGSIASGFDVTLTEQGQDRLANDRQRPSSRREGEFLDRAFGNLDEQLGAEGPINVSARPRGPSTPTWSLNPDALGALGAVAAAEPGPFGEIGTGGVLVLGSIIAGAAGLDAALNAPARQPELDRPEDRTVPARQPELDVSEEVEVGGGSEMTVDEQTEPYSRDELQVPDDVYPASEIDVGDNRPTTEDSELEIPKEDMPTIQASELIQTGEVDEELDDEESQEDDLGVPEDDPFRVSDKRLYDPKRSFGEQESIVSDVDPTKSEVGESEEDIGEGITGGETGFEPARGETVEENFRRYLEERRRREDAATRQEVLYEREFPVGRESVVGRVQDRVSQAETQRTLQREQPRLREDLYERVGVGPREALDVVPGVGTRERNRVRGRSDLLPRVRYRSRQRQDPARTAADTARARLDERLRTEQVVENQLVAGSAGIGFPYEYGYGYDYPYEYPTPGTPTPAPRRRRPRNLDVGENRLGMTGGLGVVPGDDEQSASPLAPGWLSETVTDLALGAETEVTPSQQELEEAPGVLRLTGELPTAAFLDEESREEIEDVQELLGGY